MKKHSKKLKGRSRRKLLFLACTFVLLFTLGTIATFAADPGTTVTVDGAALVGDMVDILVAGVTSVATGLGTGLSVLVQSIFLSSSGSLSVFGVVILAFGGISLALGLCYKIVNMCTSLGH